MPVHCEPPLEAIVMTSHKKHSDLTPQERLAISRKAIVKFMAKGSERTINNEQANLGAEDSPGKRSTQSAGSIWQNLRHTLYSWWQHHPAQLALDLAIPVLGRYAEKKPLQLLGLAAGAGAAIVLIRPWRLVSVTGLLLTALKSSKVSTLVLSLLTNHNSSTQSPPVDR